MKQNQQLIYTLDFADIGLKDISRVGGKNASITSISLNPDVAIKTHLIIADEENLLAGAQPLKSAPPMDEGRKLTMAAGFASNSRCHKEAQKAQTIS